MSDEAAALDAALLHVGRYTDAVLFGASRDGLSRFDIAAMRIYLRELRKMTLEEIESAFLGFNVAWEDWPQEGTPIIGDKNVPPGAMYGLAAWLPVTP